MTTLDKEQNHKKEFLILIYSAFIAGLCSIIYELLIATTTSYFLGNSVLYFSLTIGIYMASMGLGSFISKFINNNLLQKFIIIELWLGTVGGLSVPILYFAFAFTDVFGFIYFKITFIIGLLIGLEIPLLTRLMERYSLLQFNIANVLAFDYLGAVIATVCFPLILLPLFGVYQSSLIFGIVNISLSFIILFNFPNKNTRSVLILKIATCILLLLMGLTFVLSKNTLKYWDNNLYDDRVVLSQQTRYQKIVITRFKDDVRMFLDGNLQFSSVDEHRYHESLVHVPMALLNTPAKKVLLLGAGDGLAVRELLKYTDISNITLVDLDPEIIQIAKTNHYIRQINEDSLSSDRVQTVTADAFTFLVTNTEKYDLILGDLPDPNNATLARLYSKQFFRLVKNNLSTSGIFVTQATSPYFAKNAFWTIVKTLKAADFETVLPYHVEVPSLGDWGFVLGTSQEIQPETSLLKVRTRFLETKGITNLFYFPKDLKTFESGVSTLDRPSVLNYYLKGWRHYAH